ncbi:hypothetical protein [Streptomyces sp. NPDC057877]|uniref:hypothetical protein n=1 Tax=Streptomyces sp. NPDC057877 TaxID=3346269 RepID=UPI0036A03CB1
MAAPDRGAGGKYLSVPTGCAGSLPGGAFFTLRTRTTRLILGGSAFLEGDHPKLAVERIALAATGTGVSSPPGRVRLPGLAPQAHYLVRPLPPGDSPEVNGSGTVPWLAEDVTVRATGAVLAAVGVQAPALHPEQILLLRVTAC